MQASVLRKRYDWHTIEWRIRDKGEKYATITLNAGEYIRVEEGWDIVGPMRVELSYFPNDEHTNIKYSRLKGDKFDLDDPLEYPCVSCGATRKNPCVGDNFACTFRVFYIEGGKL